jgi:hypothetical protein
LGVSAKAQVDAVEDFPSARREGAGYENAFDDALVWRVRRLLLPGEGISELMDRILK